MTAKKGSPFRHRTLDFTRATENAYGNDLTPSTFGTDRGRMRSAIPNNAKAGRLRDT